jgi:cyclophilin family peptidyl-prolyl cis-trans isomerase
MRTHLSRSVGTPVAIAAAVFACACATQQGSSRALLEPQPAALAVHAPDLFKVRFETSKGDFILTVHRDWAPLGTDRFYYLVQNHFFDEERFFRVDTNFIAQFGLNGDPRVIAAWKDFTFPDDTVHMSNKVGTVAYAMRGPNDRTTQIYINLKDNPKNNGQGFSPFAEVTSGMDVVLRIYSGYGETAGGGVRAGKQQKIIAGGNAYLTKAFPKLDYIKRAVVIPTTAP